MCEVVNKYKEPFDVYIGRGSVWGNPYVIGKDGTREEVIAKFKVAFLDQLAKGEISREQLESLQGKKLGCFCKPQACHGDVIKEEVDKLWKASPPRPEVIKVGRYFRRV